MTTIPTELAKKFMGEQPEDDASPFIREGNARYIRHDEIELSNATDALGRVGIKVEFKWRGAIIGWLRIEDVSIADGKRVVLTGIEGRQEIAAPPA